MVNWSFCIFTAILCPILQSKDSSFNEVTLSSEKLHKNIQHGDDDTISGWKKPQLHTARNQKDIRREIRLCASLVFKHFTQGSVISSYNEWDTGIDKSLSP